MSHLRPAWNATVPGGAWRGLVAPVLIAIMTTRAHRWFRAFLPAGAAGGTAAGGITGRGGESAPTMAYTKIRVHFPLEQIGTPVVTRLVTDYDLEPNLLRADVDARGGGWLVLGLAGDESRLAAAPAWMRGQGLEVTEEAEYKE